MSRQCVLNSYVRILFINNRMQIYSFFMKSGVFRGVFGIKNIGKQTRRNLSCRVPQSLFVSRHRKNSALCHFDFITNSAWNRKSRAWFKHQQVKHIYKRESNGRLINGKPMSFYSKTAHLATQNKAVFRQKCRFFISFRNKNWCTLFWI